MSYRQSFSKRISIPYRGTINYPASQSGGSLSFSGYAEDIVNVEVDVDTSIFEDSVDDCNDVINGLTASVGAMNAAQCAVIAHNAKKVSEAIIKGFFHSVSIDLGTQKAELQQKVEARLILLRKQAEALEGKQRQMQVDYQRTSARYQKLFAELNRELALRIRQVDLPVFDLVKTISKQDDRMMHTDLVQTAVTVGKENMVASAQLNTATLKRNALKALGMVNQFLSTKAFSEHTLEETTVQRQDGDVFYLPAFFYETVEQDGSRQQHCVVQKDFKEQREGVRKLMETMDFPPLCDDEREKIESYMIDEMSRQIQGNDSHSNRVRELVMKMFNKQ